MVEVVGRPTGQLVGVFGFSQPISFAVPAAHRRGHVTGPSSRTTRPPAADRRIYRDDAVDVVDLGRSTPSRRTA
jgi:hypothetical protein